MRAAHDRLHVLDLTGLVEHVADRDEQRPLVDALRTAWDRVLARVPDAQRTFEGMKARGVLVKNVSRMHPLLANCLRLTVGTPQENDLMLAALNGLLTH